MTTWRMILFVCAAIGTGAAHTERTAMNDLSLSPLPSCEPIGVSTPCGPVPQMAGGEFKIKKVYHYKKTEEQKEKNRKYMEGYRNVNRKKICLWLVSHRKQHKEEYRIRNKIWYERTKNERAVKERERKREYKRLHPEKRRQDEQRRRALLSTVIVEKSETIGARLLLCPQKCYWCGKRLYGRKWHMDHVIPLSKGGSHVSSNLVKSCESCNTSKGGKLPAEWSGAVQPVFL